ncbi:hypothetical protein C2G38_2155466 [Gigaspora rosea]|uniref:Uncharacterized protein n=1 Tax=Gigaspora rosea TaxID=44941 RepID=A0A397W575_9GLOM|nr:hypothetical protein C2G38_2155466 [Gigaspora rosea]
MDNEKIRQEKLHFRDMKKRLLEFFIIELIIIIVIWLLKVKQLQHSYLYTEPFEPVVHGTFGIDQSKTLDMFIIQEYSIQIIRDFFDEITVGSRGFGHPDHDGVKQLQHSYLYTEPFEPVVHGTFGIDQSKTLDMFIIQEYSIQIIRDFFDEITVGSRGFGHPDHDGITGFNAEEWKIYNENILERKRQTKIDLDWAEVYSKFIMFKSIYDSIKTQTFVAKNLKIKEINKMIKQAIPESMFSEISKLRKIYEFTVIVLENENINLENFLVKIQDLNITLNFLQEINRDDFLTLLTAIIEKK